MRTTVAVVFAVLALVVLADAITGPCTAGEEKLDSCNKCRCNAQGTDYVCTKKACQKNVVKRETCTPGSSYKKDCNTCVCNTEGTAARCTLRACLNQNNS